jgi:hypothetical protein
VSHRVLENITASSAGFMVEEDSLTASASCHMLLSRDFAFQENRKNDKWFVLAGGTTGFKSGQSA